MSVTAPIWVPAIFILAVPLVPPKPWSTALKARSTPEMYLPDGIGSENE